MCLIAGAGVGMDYLWTRLAGRRQWVIYTLMLISSCGLIYNLYHIWFQLERSSEEEILATIPFPYQSNSFISSNSQKLNRYGAVAKGVALICTFEPMLSWQSVPVKVIRMSIENPKYAGEIFTIPKSNTKIFWSPNRISLIATQGSRLFINQNPSCYWRVNGKKLFPKARDFELHAIMLMRISATGEKVFTLRPGLHEFAIGVTLIAIFLLLQLLILPKVYIKLKNRPKLNELDESS